MTAAWSIEDPYVQIANGTNLLGVGSALVSLVEPHVGHERDYNRWYEDDHCYSDAMMGPWMFAHRRWVAPKSLREHRVTGPGSPVDPVDAGCYLSTFWVAPEQELNHQRWATAAMSQVLGPAGRGFDQRDHVYTARHLHRFAAMRDAGPLRPIHALDAGFAGIHLEIVDAPSAAGRADLEAWFERRADSLLDGSPAAMLLGFTPIAFTEGMAPGIVVPGVHSHGERLCLLWFLDVDPRDLPVDRLHTHHQSLLSSGLGELRFAGSFIPTKVGTDDHVDELR